MKIELKKFNKEQEEYNKKIRKEYGGEIPQAQNGMNPERAYRQPDWNEEEPLELVNNFNQEVIDSGQTFVHPLLRKALVLAQH
jgi:phage-related tail protein